MKNILVPVDGSKGAADAARFAAGLARDAGATLTLLYVYDAPTVAQLGLRALSRDEIDRARLEVSRGSFEGAVAAMGDVRPPEARREVGVGPPAAEIVAWADQYHPDLIVIGSRGLSPVRGIMLGSVSDWVTRHAPCPVTVVR